MHPTAINRRRAHLRDTHACGSLAWLTNTRSTDGEMGSRGDTP